MGMICIVAVALPAWAGAAGAQEEQGPPPRAGLEEPESSPPRVCCEHSKLNTADADPLGEGVWQVQLNCAFDRSTGLWDSSGERERRGRARGRTVEVVAAYGASDALDLGVGWGYSRLAEEGGDPSEGAGPTDLTVSAKWRVLEGDLWGLALVPALTLPVGQEEMPDRLGPGRGFWGMDARLAFVLDLSGHWSLNVDAGYEAAFGGRGDSQGSLGANLALGRRLMGSFQPELEVNFGHDFIRGAADASLVALAAGYGAPLSNRLCVRGGIQRAVAGRDVDGTSSVLVSIDLRF